MAETVLIIDDEEGNIDLIETFLENLNLNFIRANDGVPAMKILHESHQDIDLILLDRMMPCMDGMEVMENINEHPEISKIPVIMQTAAATTEQVAEGIKTGVYYYLIKPFDEDLLVSIVKTALEKVRSSNKQKQSLSRYRNMLGLMDNCQLLFQSLSEAQNLAMLMASFYPKPDDIVVGISELLINAVEHGNLGITFEEKTELVKNDTWAKEVSRRMELSKYKDRKVEVSYEKTDKEITLSIKDEGDGFEWKNYLELSSKVLSRAHGRGIPMCKHVFFDKIEFNDKGNEVHCTTLLEHFK